MIDTLQKIRDIIPDSNSYASDYRDLSSLKNLAESHHIAILLIHHLRKMKDDDPMNMISGTTGLSGAADSNFVLTRKDRNSPQAELHCTGRDIESRVLGLCFRKETRTWELSKPIESEKEATDPELIFLSEFLNQRRYFTGTATELAEALDEFAGEQYKPNVLMKKLLRCQQELLEQGIILSTRRTHDRRELTLRVGCVGNDGKNDTGPVSDLLSQPSQLSQEKPVPPE